MNETLDVIRQLDNNDMDASILKDQMRQIASSKLPSFALTEAASSNMDLDMSRGDKSIYDRDRNRKTSIFEPIFNILSTKSRAVDPEAELE